VQSIARHQVDPVDQSTPNGFLTTYDWNREKLNRTLLQLLQSEKATRWRRDGVVAIDDTLLPRRGKKMPGAGRLYSKSRCLRGEEEANTILSL
jgi:CHAD domain-containing protein